MVIETSAGIAQTRTRTAVNTTRSAACIRRIKSAKAIPMTIVPTTATVVNSTLRTRTCQNCGSVKMSV